MTKNEILSSDIEVRITAACNPSTPAEALAELAKDSDWYVRYYVACNPNTPAEALAELAKDSDWHVRMNVAWNPKLKEVLTDKK